MTIREAITHLQGTLCPYKVRCNSEVTEKDNEAFDTLWNSIEKAERYRWHDLRKNPQDLPNDYIEVYVCDKDQDGYITYTIANRWMGTWHDVDRLIGVWNVIAWREIEPFESEERDEKVC